jgi:ubiquinone/menaquinone biosynthesis C-methylase UbiE
MQEFLVDNQLKQNYDAYYEEGALEWRRLGAIDKVDNIVRLCTSIPHDKILEVGAGDGSILQEMSNRKFGNAHYALEISRSGIEVIQQRSISTLVECKEFDGYTIPYDNNSFDLVILTHVLEHVEYPRKLLYELARVTKYVCIEVPLEDNRRSPKDYKPTSLGHINFYNPQTFRHLVQTCGFGIVDQTVTNVPIQMYRHSDGLKGIIQFSIKELGLRLFPHMATACWTYHSTLLCSSPRS